MSSIMKQVHKWLRPGPLRPCWPSYKSRMTLWLFLSSVVHLHPTPHPASLFWSSHPLELICVWNPIEDQETFIRRLGLRRHPQFIPHVLWPGAASSLVRPFDNDSFQMINLKFWSGKNVRGWLWCSSGSWAACLPWLILPLASASSVFLLALPSHPCRAKSNMINRAQCLPGPRALRVACTVKGLPQVHLNPVCLGGHRRVWMMRERKSVLRLNCASQSCGIPSPANSAQFHWRLELKSWTAPESCLLPDLSLKGIFVMKGIGTDPYAK